MSTNANAKKETSSNASSKEPPKMTTVIATKGKGDDETEEISYTDAKVIGNGSFGVSSMDWMRGHEKTIREFRFDLEAEPC